ncbi:hypothetical protein FRC07_008718 [Ceratobasidium sp. 392]|nr:hypothetical protein FRC07_008718 [Ceratobasidium sp. 392]
MRSFTSAAPRLHSLSIESPFASRWKSFPQPKTSRFGGIAAATVGLGLTVFTGRSIYCEGSVPPTRGPATSTNQPRFGSDPLPPPPEYFNAIDITKVNWGTASTRFERLFYSQPAEPGGKPRAPTIASVWAWLVDFLTADFPPRATFLAGLLLGLRLG